MSENSELIRTENFMTNDKDQTEREEQIAPESVDEPRYQIDAKGFEASGRSFSYAIYSRLSASGKTAVDDGKTPGGFGAPSEYMKVMSNICQNEPDFLFPGTPITEAIFKLLLANKNRAMNLEEIKAGLTDAWASVIYLKNLSDDVLRRMLDQENAYFIKRAVRRRRRAAKGKARA